MVPSSSTTLGTPPVAPAPSTSAEEADAARFRQEFGLNSDPAYIASLYASPSVDAMSQDYGTPLTQDELHDMRSRLVLQNAVDSLGAQAAAAYPDTYGGMWIDQQAGGIVHLAFTRNAAASVAALAQTVPQFAADLVPNTVAYTLNQLSATVAAISADVQSLSGQGINILGVHLDLLGNAVDAMVPSVTTSIVAALTGTYGNLVTTLSASGTDTLDANPPRTRMRSYPPLEGGVAVNNCTTAFAAFRNPSDATIATFPADQMPGASFYMLTAGHCRGFGADSTGSGNYFFVFQRNGRAVRIGQLDHNARLDNPTGADALTIAIAGSDAHPYYYATANRDVYSRDYQRASADDFGDQVCLAGVNAPLLRCGEIVDTDYTSPDLVAPGGEITGQRLADYSSSPGDSGGAVVLDDRRGIAEGIHRGRTKALVINGRPLQQYAVFGQINNVARQLHVCLLLAVSGKQNTALCKEPPVSSSGSMGPELPLDFPLVAP